MTRKTIDPSSSLYQVGITGTGLGPNDSMIDDGIGSVPLARDSDPQDDAGTPMMPAAPPGSVATHADIQESDHNMLADCHYTMKGND